MELDAGVRATLDDLFVDEREQLAEQQRQMAHIFGLCATPLQQRFLLRFLQHSGFGGQRPSDWRDVWHITFPDCGDPHYYGVYLDVYPHYPIELSNTAAPEYHADFLFVLRRWDWHAAGNWADHMRLVVEIDEQAGPHRSPEQARHEQSRDRFMAARGWDVLRFTATEVRDELAVDATTGPLTGVVVRLVDFILGKMAETTPNTRND